MRPAPVAAAALAAALGACGTRATPYRFSSPMLGTASLPLSPLPSAEPPANHTDRTARPIRAVSAPPIREAHLPPSPLPAPHLSPSSPPPSVSSPLSLRTLVGFRDKREPTPTILSLVHDVGGTAPTDLTTGDAPSSATTPGDLLVFDRATSDAPADLVAIVIATDDRGVTEFLYLGGGVYRRGFLDPSHPSRRRSSTGAVLNTYLRTGRRWPAPGTHYLAGELIAHVIHTR